jgi:glycosyltransferase involved in cell wall biosynthesis
MAELAMHEKTALVVTPEDVGSLQKALLRLLNDEGFGKTLGDQARLHSSERFSLQGMLDRMEAIYRQACGPQ